MKMKLLVTGFALTMVALVSSAADVMGSVDTPTPGVWCNNFKATKDYADAANIPMLVFCAKTGCSQCGKLESACNSPAFKAWAADRGLLMVFGLTTNSELKKFAKTPNSTQLPYIAVYWKSNDAGVTVYERFTGRSGKMGHGAKKSGALEQQLIDAVEDSLGSWTPAPAPAPTPAPTPVPAPALDMTKAFGEPKTIGAVVIDKASGYYCGTATISVGKISKSKKTVKVTVKASLFVGKTVSANVTETPVAKSDKIAAISETTLSFKSPLGAMGFDLAYDSTTKALVAAVENDQYAIVAEEVVIGGSLGKDKMFFGAALPDELEFPTGYTRLADIHVPFGEPVYIKNGTKFSVDKAAVLKYKKVDGAYVLTGQDDPKKPNLSGLKLTYTSKTGAFKGSFYVYAVKPAARAGAKPTLKKYTAKVSGVVVNGIGYGIVTVKIGRETYSGVCQLD